MQNINTIPKWALLLYQYEFKQLHRDQRRHKKRGARLHAHLADVDLNDPRVKKRAFKRYVREVKAHFAIKATYKVLRAALAPLFAMPLLLFFCCSSPLELSWLSTARINTVR